MIANRLSIVIVMFSAFTVIAQEPAVKIDFAHDIVPILKAKCAECHTNGTYKGGISFDTREDLLKSKSAVPGKSAESELVHRVVSKDPELRMPPKGAALTDKEVNLLKAWIDGGLKWEDGFRFKPKGYVAPTKLRKIALPPARPGRDHPIDRIVDAYFTGKKLNAPPLLVVKGYSLPEFKALLKSGVARDGRDLYAQGKGNMLIKAAALLPVEVWAPRAWATRRPRPASARALPPSGTE